MISSIKEALDEARRERAEGRPRNAELAYGRAAELARSNGDALALAHALRHMSDLARHRDASSEALAHATEAVAIYRASADRLGLANAVRLQALSAPDPEKASAFWLEARGLYEELGVTAGVTECDLKIGARPL